MSLKNPNQSEVNRMGATLTDNQAKLDNIDKAIKEALERKRKVGSFQS